MSAMGQTTRLTVVVPAHNEAANIAAIYEAITQAVAPLDVVLELVFVDDGSSDGTATLVTELATHDGAGALDRPDPQLRPSGRGLGRR